MAERRNSNSGGDIYGEMYDRELEKNQRMADRSRRSEKPDFNAGDERRRQNFRNRGEQYSGGRQQGTTRRSVGDGQMNRPDFRLDNGGFTGYNSGSSEPTHSHSHSHSSHRSSSHHSHSSHSSQSSQSSQSGYDYGSGGGGTSRQSRGTQSSYDYSGSGYDGTPIIGRSDSQSAYSYAGAGASRGYGGYGSDDDYRPQSIYNYADSSEPHYSHHSGEHRHHHSSYDDGQRRVKRYAEEAEHKHGKEQLAFGRHDHEGEKISEVKSFSFGSFLKILFVLIIIIVLLSQVLVVRYISMVHSVPSGSRAVTAAEFSDSKVTNVLLIGSDSRGTDDSDHNGRTDSMILATINSRSKEITLTSILRDSYVEIPGRGWGKLNSAYTYGGVELVLDTIQHNFGVQVDKYVFVDFFSFITIIDAAGGINLDITDEEAQGMQPPLAEQNKYLNNEKGTDYLARGGTDLTVNGNQALAYARLRYVGNADFERTDRQRLVINKLIEKSKTLDLLSLDNFLKTSCRELTTNMSGSEMYILFYKLMFALFYSRGEMRIPADGTYVYGDHDGLSTLDLNFDACKQVIREQLYK